MLNRTDDFLDNILEIQNNQELKEKLLNYEPISFENGTSLCRSYSEPDTLVFSYRLNPEDKSAIISVVLKRKFNLDEL